MFIRPLFKKRALEIINQSGLLDKKINNKILIKYVKVIINKNVNLKIPKIVKR